MTEWFCLDQIADIRHQSSYRWISCCCWRCWRPACWAWLLCPLRRGRSCRGSVRSAPTVRPTLTAAAAVSAVSAPPLQRWGPFLFDFFILIFFLTLARLHYKLSFNFSPAGWLQILQERRGWVWVPGPVWEGMQNLQGEGGKGSSKLQRGLIHVM